jgi:ubiquitin-protein ligase
MYHPNVRDSGEVCLSILTPANHESEEGWLPVRTVASVLMYVISVLNDPNCEAPENIEAARTFLTDRMEYARKVQRVVTYARHLVGLP